MLPTQIPETEPDHFSRCEEPGQKETEHGKSLSPGQKTDAAMKGSIDRALLKDDVLRAIEFHEIDIHVKSGVAYLNGHIVSTTSQNRIQNAIAAIPGLRAIQNNLVLDDKLTHEVARSLGSLEHTYGCKFFTGASHGVISLNGNVSDENVKLLAEKQAASHPSVRGVINSVRVSGAELDPPDQPFSQPTIGENIYFLDGVSGTVKQVVINPNNRRVIAMTVWGQFADRRQDLKSLNRGGSRSPSPECLVVVPIDVVRYMTTVSGFLDIKSDEQDRYMDFDSASFRATNLDWTPPYPYCPADVLFPVEKRAVEYQVLEELPQSPFVVAWVEQPLGKELLANDSLGG